jgi:hypothetical protein
MLPRRLSRLEQGKIYPFAPKINVFVELREVQQSIQKVLPKFILKSEVHRRTVGPHAHQHQLLFLETPFPRSCSSLPDYCNSIVRLKYYTMFTLYQKGMKGNVLT